jgi:hypothetical protein
MKQPNRKITLLLLAVVIMVLPACFLFKKKCDCPTFGQLEESSKPHLKKLKDTPAAFIHTAGFSKFTTVPSLQTTISNDFFTLRYYQISKSAL